jgi:eukaryotic-like serine/threonine-protein kinase
MIHLSSCPVAPDLYMVEFDAEPNLDQTQSQLLLGDRNRYRLEQEIGKGGMGKVFLAIDTRLNKQVALKLLSPGLVNSEAACQRFRQECAICAALKSPHIVQVSDYGITNGHPFYVMEYLQGETLRQLLARSPRLMPKQVASLLRQICAGLQVAHHGVVLEDQETQTSRLIKVIHRDLKPDNIFLVPTALGELVKIIDFGIAKIRSLQENTSEITQSLLGTSHYAAPEQFETAELDERTDIYSLGIILYEMLTGTDPYGLGFNNHPVSNTAWLTAHLTKPALPLRSQPGCEQMPPALEAIVLRCLAKLPADRFASVEALNQTFQAAVTESISEPVPNRVLKPENHPRSLQQAQQAFWLRFLPGLVIVGLTTASVVGLKYVLRSTSGQPHPQVRATGLSLSRTLLGHQAAVWALALGGDEKTLISSDEAGMIKVWDLPTGQLERTLTAQPGAVRALSLSRDQQLLVSGGDNIQIWDMQTGRSRTLYAQPVWTVALSQDQKLLVSGSEDRLIRIWNLENAEQFRTLSGHTAGIYAVVISPDQNTIISGSQDKTVKVWDTQSGSPVHTFTGHQDVVRCVAFRAEGDLIASGSWDKTVKIWDLKTKTLVHTLEGHQDRVIAVAFSEDGRILASTSLDRTIKLWDVQTGKLLQSLSGHRDWVLSVGISREGQTIVSGSSDQSIRIWQ